MFYIKSVFLKSCVLIYNSFSNSVPISFNICILKPKHCATDLRNCWSQHKYPCPSLQPLAGAVSSSCPSPCWSSCQAWSSFSRAVSQVEWEVEDLVVEDQLLAVELGVVEMVKRFVHRAVEESSLESEVVVVEMDTLLVVDVAT